MNQDRSIKPTEIEIGDIITSDPRRDFTVADLEVDEMGDVTVYSDDGVKVFIGSHQSVSVRR